VEGALFYAACRASHTGAHVLLLYVIEPDTQVWDAVRQAQLEEQTTKAKALFRLFRRKLSNDGLDMVPIEEVIREGKKVDAILQQIDEDEDIAILVLGASKEATGPGPLRGRPPANSQFRSPWFPVSWRSPTFRRWPKLASWALTNPPNKFKRPPCAGLAF
jgi:nucleotide-binding universal stress UspA family protein